MRVYVIGMVNSNSIGEEPYITPPYLHSNFISELTKTHEMMSDELGVPFRRKDEVTKIEDITEDFLLAQPTGKKIYINSTSCSRYYLYFMPYEILETDIKPGKKLSRKTQLYNLGWLIENAERITARTTEWDLPDLYVIINTDPLSTVLKVKTLCPGQEFTLSRLHDTAKLYFNCSEDKLHRLRRYLMPVP
jgi:hypothetical protein